MILVSKQNRIQECNFEDHRKECGRRNVTEEQKRISEHSAKCGYQNIRNYVYIDCRAQGDVKYSKLENVRIA
jgi:hypothetical protein